MRKISIIFLVLLFNVPVKSQWISQNSSVSSYISSVFFINPTNGYACCESGSPGTVLKTTNGGINWVSIYSGFQTDLLSICFTNETTGYMVDASEHILKTSNGGLNWFGQGNPGNGNFLIGVAFGDSLTGYIAGGGGETPGCIYKTTNGGNIWTWLPGALLLIYMIIIVYAL